MPRTNDVDGWLTTVQRIMPDDCWNWPWAKKPNGYGAVRIDGRLRYTHRAMYERLVGPIPEGLEIDHLCRNHACCNPAHLEPVDRATNARRGETGLYLKLRTHCPKGHPYSEENTHRNALGWRWCRTCKRDSHHSTQGG